MDFDIPAEIAAYLRELDEFIEREIRPLERENDNIRFFDHRREHARTDWDNDGQPRHEWEALLAEMRRRADKAGHLRFALPKELGGKEGSNLAMAIIREHLGLPGTGYDAGLQGRGNVVDLQHAVGPRRGLAHRRPGAGLDHAGRGRSRPRRGADLRAREPHPSGGVEPRRGAILHRYVGRLRQEPQG